MSEDNNKHNVLSLLSVVVLLMCLFAAAPAIYHWINFGELGLGGLFLFLPLTLIKGLVFLYIPVHWACLKMPVAVRAWVILGISLLGLTISIGLQYLWYNHSEPVFSAEYYNEEGFYLTLFANGRYKAEYHKFFEKSVRYGWYEVIDDTTLVAVPPLLFGKHSLRNPLHYSSPQLDFEFVLPWRNQITSGSFTVHDNKLLPPG